MTSVFILSTYRAPLANKENLPLYSTLQTTGLVTGQE